MLKSNITDVQAVDGVEGAYILNDCVKISDIDIAEDQFIFDVDYKEEIIDEKEAIELCEEFLYSAVRNSSDVDRDPTDEK